MTAADPEVHEVLVAARALIAEPTCGVSAMPEPLTPETPVLVRMYYVESDGPGEWWVRDARGGEWFLPSAEVIPLDDSLVEAIAEIHEHHSQQLDDPRGDCDCGWFADARWPLVFFHARHVSEQIVAYLKGDRP